LTAWRRIPGPPRDRVKARLLRLYRALLARYGHQHWWPARTPFEVAVGAILTQHTAWTGAARAVAALRGRGLLAPHRLAFADATLVAELVRPAGTYRLKARRLQDFARWLVARFGGDFREMRRAPLGPLRREVLSVPGLGPETADAILLYAAGRPVFVADAYTRRVLARHRLLPHGEDYERTRAWL
jgi:endonuclease III related protein